MASGASTLRRRKTSGFSRSRSPAAACIWYSSPPSVLSLSTYLVRASVSVAFVTSPARTFGTSASPAASSRRRRLGPGGSSRSAIISSRFPTARAASGMYFARLFFLSLRSFAASCRTSLMRSCSPHWFSACFTASPMTAMSPMYSLLVPLKGTFVLTMLTKTPTFWSRLIL